MTAKCYNNGEINFITQTSLKRYFVCYAKRNPESLFFLRRNAHHPLWWDVVDSAFLQKDWSEETSAKLHPACPEKPRLPSLRTLSGSDVCHYHGPSAYQQDRNPQVQRRLPGDAGNCPLPGPIHPAPISETPVSQDNPPFGQAPRQYQGLSVSSSDRTNYPDIRLGFCSNNRLREPGRSQDGLQSQKERQAFLPSLALFRIPLSRILAWEFKTGRYCKFYRSSSLYKDLFEKDTQNYCPLPHPVPDGPRILRQPYGSFLGQYRMWLCNCCQAIFHYQKKGTDLPVSFRWRWLGSRRIPGAGALDLEKETPLLW